MIRHKACLTWFLVCYLFSVAEQVKHSTANFDSAAKIHCFNEQWSTGSDSFYIDVEFKSTNPSSDYETVAKYLPSSSAKTLFNSFQGLDTKVHFYVQDSIGYMQIDNVTLNQEGMYRCKGNGFHAPPNLVMITSLTIFVLPSIKVVKLTDLSASMNTLTNVARCDATAGKPAASVVWISPRYQAIDSVSRIVNKSDGTSTVSATLQFTPTRFYDKEQFQCEIRHDGFGPNQKRIRFFTANVTYPPESVRITVDKENKYLTCTGEGNPPLKYSWIKPGGTQQTAGSTIDLQDANDPNHLNDTYICVATNSVGQKSINITTYEATQIVHMTNVSNVGLIVGAVIGALVLVIIVIAIVYFTYFRKFRKTDKGPYHQRATLVRQSTDKPTIQHANDTLNKNRPPSPSQPPPDHDHDDEHSSSSESEHGGNHDVDLDTKVPQYNPQEEDTGITSRSSMNFRARRQRPSSSPSSRRSRAEMQMQKHANDSPPPHSGARYEIPPVEDEDNGYGYDKSGYMQPGQQYSNDTYPYHQPHRGDYNDEEEAGFGDPSRYEPKYSEIDHSGYRKGEASYTRRHPHEEPVEYAQIMSQGHGTHIV